MDPTQNSVTIAAMPIQKHDDGRLCIYIYQCEPMHINACSQFNSLGTPYPCRLERKFLYRYINIGVYIYIYTCIYTYAHILCTHMRTRRYCNLSPSSHNNLLYFGFENRIYLQHHLFKTDLLTHRGLAIALAPRLHRLTCIPTRKRCRFNTQLPNADVDL